MKDEIIKILIADVVEFEVPFDMVADKILDLVDEKELELLGTSSERPGDLHNVSNLLIAWKQFKKANWWESEAIDVEKVLMNKFAATYRC